MPPGGPGSYQLIRFMASIVHDKMGIANLQVVKRQFPAHVSSDSREGLVIIPPPAIGIYDPPFSRCRKPLAYSPQSSSASSRSPFASGSLQHQLQGFQSTSADLAAASMASPDVTAVANLFGTMKHTLAKMGNMFGNLARQTEEMASLGPAIKATEQVTPILPSFVRIHSPRLQINDVRAKLEKQIQKQEASMQEVRLLLESVIQENLIKHLKVQIYGVIQTAIAKEIKERVQREVLRTT